MGSFRSKADFRKKAGCPLLRGYMRQFFFSNNDKGVTPILHQNSLFMTMSATLVQPLHSKKKKEK